MSWKSTESYGWSVPLRIYAMVWGKAPTLGVRRSRANTNMNCTLTHHHVGSLSGLSCRNCSEFGQMCTPALWPGKCVHIKGDLKSYLLIHKESKRTSAHGWPLSCEQPARWDQALLFFPCCCSLILLNPAAKAVHWTCTQACPREGGDFAGPQPRERTQGCQDVDDSHSTCLQQKRHFWSWHPHDPTKSLV